MSKGKGKGMAYGAFALEFIGGILFLATAAFFISTGYSSALSSWNSSYASIWLPFIYPAAILASILVFIVSFANLGGWEGMASAMSYKLAWIAGATLIVLTAGTSMMWVPILGFVLTILGAAMTMKRM
jgi:hypothetical protein